MHPGARSVALNLIVCCVLAGVPVLYALGDAQHGLGFRNQRPVHKDLFNKHPSPPNSTCCGYIKDLCVSCPDSSSCATWSPLQKHPTRCPPPDPNHYSNKFGTCAWRLQAKLTVYNDDSLVLRCHSVTGSRTTISWDVRTDNGEKFWSRIFDQANFDAFITNGDYVCLNKRCLNETPKPRSQGKLEAHKSTGFYIVVSEVKARVSIEASIS